MEINTTTIIVLSLIFFVTIFGTRILTYVKEKELCPCLIKVPVTAATLTAMILTFFFFNSNIDLIIWGPFVGLVMLGNFFVGSLSERFEAFYTLGVISFILSYIYSSIAIYITYGFPSIYSVIMTAIFFVSYFSITFLTFEVKIKEVWYEYFYSLFLFILITFSTNLKIGIPALIAVIVYTMSELFLQIIRINKNNLMDEKVEYDIALIYLLGIVIFSIPKNIF